MLLNNEDSTRYSSDSQFIHDTKTSGDSNISSFTRKFLTVCSFFGLILFWIAESEMAQIVIYELDSPSLLSYLSKSILVFVIIFPLSYNCYNNNTEPKYTVIDRPDIYSDNNKSLSTIITQYFHNYAYLFKISLVLSIIYFFCGYLFWAGIKLTSVAQASAAFDCSIAFTYVFALYFLNDKFDTIKLLSVLVSVGGVLMVSFSGLYDDNNSSNLSNPVLGDLLCTGGGILYALASVLYNKYGIKDDSVPLIVITILLSAIGIVSLSILWIFVPLFNITGIESAEFHTNNTNVYYNIILYSLLGLGFSFSYLSALSLTINPVLVNIAGLVVIPVSSIVDYIIYKTTVPTLAIFGSCLIVISFIIMVFRDRKLNKT